MRNETTGRATMTLRRLWDESGVLLLDALDEPRLVGQQRHFRIVWPLATPTTSHHGRRRILVVHGESGQRREQGNSGGHQEPDVISVQVGDIVAGHRVYRVQQRDDRC